MVVLERHFHYRPSPPAPASSSACCVVIDGADGFWLEKVYVCLLASYLACGGIEPILHHGCIQYRNHKQKLIQFANCKKWKSIAKVRRTLCRLYKKINFAQSWQRWNCHSSQAEQQQHHQRQAATTEPPLLKVCRRFAWCPAFRLCEGAHGPRRRARCRRRQQFVQNVHHVCSIICSRLSPGADDWRHALKGQTRHPQTHIEGERKRASPRRVRTRSFWAPNTGCHKLQVINLHFASRLPNERTSNGAVARYGIQSAAAFLRVARFVLFYLFTNHQPRQPLSPTGSGGWLRH